LVCVCVCAFALWILSKILRVSLKSIFCV